MWLTRKHLAVNAPITSVHELHVAVAVAARAAKRVGVVDEPFHGAIEHQRGSLARKAGKTSRGSAKGWPWPRDVSWNVRCDRLEAAVWVLREARH
jgi:hypothetical protein